MVVKFKKHHKCQVAQLLGVDFFDIDKWYAVDQSYKREGLIKLIKLPQFVSCGPFSIIRVSKSMNDFRVGRSFCKLCNVDFDCKFNICQNCGVKLLPYAVSYDVVNSIDGVVKGVLTRLFPKLGLPE